MPSPNAIAPPPSTARFRLSRISPLTSTLTKFAPASPLAPTLTRKLTFKSFTINTYKKGGEGEGVGARSGQSTSQPLYPEAPVRGPKGQESNAETAKRRRAAALQKGRRDFDFGGRVRYKWGRGPQAQRDFD